MPLEGRLCHALSGAASGSILLTVLRPTCSVDRLLRASAELRHRQEGGSDASSDSALSGTGSSTAVVPAAGALSVDADDGHLYDRGGGDGVGSGDDGALASTTALTAAAGTRTGSGEYEGRTLAQTAWGSPSTAPAKSRQSRTTTTTTTDTMTTAASSPRLASPERRFLPRGAGLLAEVDELGWRAERLAC